jgi:holo-[acyl-carrier protein] synthase
MLYGIGTDIVSVNRMSGALQRHGERFAERILTPEELSEFRRVKDAPRFLAKRFAAKEACAKALGTGLRPPATLQAIAVVHDALGKPAYAFDPSLASRCEELGVVAHLTISDEHDYVVAFAIMERTR